MTIRLINPEGLVPLPRPPLAAIGVDILFEEGILVEAEVTAVADQRDLPPPTQAGA